MKGVINYQFPGIPCKTRNRDELAGIDMLVAEKSGFEVTPANGEAKPPELVAARAN